MNTYRIAGSDLVVSRIAYGCATLGGSWDKELLAADTIRKAERTVNTAYDHGITFFDHADVYGLGKAEQAFGAVLARSPGLREKIVIQTKCGGRMPDEPTPGDPPRNDLSREHIVISVEGSLRRLGTTHLDILLLHSRDALMEAEEVAQAFDDLHRSGKVRHFGVSNHTPLQLALLQKYVRQPIVVNQIYLGLAHCHLIADGMEHTLEFAQEMPRMLQGMGKKQLSNSYVGISEAGTLDYCRLHDIQIQAYSPLRGNLLKPAPGASLQIERTAQLLRDLAREKNSTPAAISLAWLLRHPAHIVPIIGATDPGHIVESCAADRLELNREEWYNLFVAAAEIERRTLPAHP